MLIKICISGNCNSHAQKGHNYCRTCRNEKYRMQDPIKYAYGNLKGNAKSRGIQFDLTLQEFRDFCVRYQYMVKKGRERDSYTVDRIRNWEGYHKDNLQMLTLSDNVKKYLTYDIHKMKLVAAEVLRVDTSRLNVPF